MRKTNPQLTSTTAGAFTGKLFLAKKRGRVAALFILAVALTAAAVTTMSSAQSKRRARAAAAAAAKAKPSRKGSSAKENSVSPLVSPAGRAARAVSLSGRRDDQDQEAREAASNAPYAGPPTDLTPVEAVRSPSLHKVHAIPPPARGDNDREEREPMRPDPPTRSDPVFNVNVQSAPGAEVSAPSAAGLNFDGVGVGLNGFSPSSNPPDVNGHVGATQYVQWNNTSFAVFNKATGALLYGPVAGNTLFQKLGGVCASHNDGDPVVNYDILSGRWVLSQFAVDGPAGSASHQCIAVSVTQDAAGAYYLYDFLTDGTNFVDYPHIGVWPDGYYMSAHIFNAAGTVQVAARVYVFERDKMILGQPARMQVKDLTKYNTTGSCTTGAGCRFQYGFLPADLDSLTPPPAGEAEFILGPDPAIANRTDSTRVAVTWGATPTMTLTQAQITSVGVSAPPCLVSAANRQCVPQPSPATTTDYVDNITAHYMYRLAYRNFGGSPVQESLVISAPNAGSTSTPAHGAVRWFEFRNAGNSTATPTNFQLGTFDPDTSYRWLPSIAMDKDHNIALGYSKSSTTVIPGIYITGRLGTDTVNTMGAEATVMAGGGVQLAASNRWGDYSAMTLDPVDQCTFWYTNEYLKANGGFNWSTRIATYSFPSCVPASWGTVTGHIQQVNSGASLSGVVVTLSNGFAAATDVSGNYSITVPAGSYTATATDADRNCTSSLPASRSITVTNGLESSGNDFTMDGGSNLQANGLSIDDSTGNNNGIVNANECFVVNLGLKNNGCADESATTSTLTTTTPGVTITQNASAYPDLATDVAGVNATPFRLQTSSDFVCGSPIALTLNTSSAGGAKSVTYSIATCGGGANQTIPSGSLTTTDLTQNDRLGRDGVPSTCSGKISPGGGFAGTKYYKSYTFTNNASVPVCFTVTINAALGGAGDIESAAYDQTYNPAGISANYLGDTGISGLGTTVGTASYSFTVPANHNFVVVVNTTGTTTSSVFSGTVSGFLNTAGGPGACAPTQQSTTLAVAPTTGTYGGAVNLSATLTAGANGVSGKSVAFTLNGNSVGSANTDAGGVATLSNVSLAGINAGSYPTAIGASFAGDSGYTSSNGSAALTVNKADTTTSVTAANATYDGNPHGGSASVTGPAGLSQSVTVSYSGRNGTSYGPSTTAPTSGGDYTASASYAGDSNYNASSDSKDYSIGKASQTITFGALADKTYGDADFSVSATATSGLAVSFGASGNCSVTGNTVHITGAGSCTITATQGGDSNYNAAADVPQSFNVAKASQTINFGALADKKYDDADFGVSASATSGLTVGFAASGNCTVSGSTVHITGVGSCTITASQPGDANYNAASDVPQSFNIAKATASIVLSNLSFTYDGTAKSATATTTPAGLNVVITYAPAAQAPRRKNIASANPIDAGSYTVTATIDDPNYEGTASDTLVISKADANVSVTGFTGVYDGSPHAASGTATGAQNEDLSGLLDFGSSYTNVPGGTAHWTFNAGDANTNYNSKSGDVQITISKATPTITWTPADMVYGTPLGVRQLRAISSVDGSFVYTPAAGTVLSKGSHTLHADFTPADSVNYNPTSADATVNVLSAVLSVSMIADRNPAPVGQNFNYKATITNTGDAQSANTVLTDELPTQVSLTSVSSTQGSCSVSGTRTVVCNLGAIPAGGSALVTITVKPLSEGTLNDTASITASQWDPATGNSSASVNGLQAVKIVDLSVSKTDSVDPIFVGDDTTYTMVVKNSNTVSSATGVTLQDSLPAGLTFVSGTTSQGGLVTPPVGSSGIVTANIGTMAPNAIVTVTVTAKGAAAGVQVNSATVSGNETDSNSSNNTATQSTTVKPQPTVTLQKVLLAKQVLTGGCENTTGNVYLTAPAPAGGVNVGLSSNVGGASVPSSVFISAGQMVSPAFTVTTSQVNAKQVGLITAASGASSASRGITINVGNGCP